LAALVVAFELLPASVAASPPHAARSVPVDARFDTVVRLNLRHCVFLI
jgi:hypothetical protein